MGNFISSLLDHSAPQGGGIGNAISGLVEKGYAVIDVRTPEEYEEGHIKEHKTSMSNQAFVTEIENPKSDTLLVYCRSGRRSLCRSGDGSLAFKNLRFEGGFLNWESE